MAALINALDHYTPSQFGENANIEYTWSNDIQERIVQLNFQLSRTKDSNILNQLAMQTDKTLKEITNFYNKGILDKENYLTYMSIMYRMIGQTRDIIDGKGEYTLAYTLLNVWYNFNPDLAKFAFKQFFISENNTHPYGSWKDIKYLYKYNNESPLVQYGIKLINEQLTKDSTSDKPSLAAKWIPREKSQFSELFTQLAIDYFSNYINSAKTEVSRKKAFIKAKMDYRKLISCLNKKLDTVQIKQCALNWAAIEPEKQTSITMQKQSRAFLNLNNKDHTDTLDRIICAEKFSEYATKALNGETIVKGKRVGLNDFTASALRIINSTIAHDGDDAKLLNAQWRDNSTQTGTLGKMVAMVDVSGSMDGDPMNAAIALGIRIAEKSMLGKRIMTFSAYPKWINLSCYDNFIDMVNVISHSDWGTNTNIASAMRMILEAIILNKLKPEDVEDMVLTILSDMQIDQADKNGKILYDIIEEMYSEAGKRVWGKPYKPPHILFWNLRSTSGFPTLSTQKNCSMVSGFNPSMLNLFCEQGMSSLQSCSPWNFLVKSLENERYTVLDTYIRTVL